ncbi:MAG: hypothetical protein GXO42_00465 [bacterium]|nr:hypothetical protein [bacterium]
MKAKYLEAVFGALLLISAVLGIVAALIFTVKHVPGILVKSIKNRASLAVDQILLYGAVAQQVCEISHLKLIEIVGTVPALVSVVLLLVAGILAAVAALAQIRQAKGSEGIKAVGGILLFIGAVLALALYMLQCHSKQLPTAIPKKWFWPMLIAGIGLVCYGIGKIIERRQALSIAAGVALIIAGAFMLAARAEAVATAHRINQWPNMYWLPLAAKILLIIAGALIIVAAVTKKEEKALAE